MSMIDLATYAAVKKLLGGGSGGGASAYIAKSVDELPSNAVDDSMAIVENDSLVGRWQWRSYEKPLDLSMFNFESSESLDTMVQIHCFDEVAGVFSHFRFEKPANVDQDDLTIYVGESVLYTGQAFDDGYVYFTFYTDILEDSYEISKDIFKEFIKANCLMVGGGYSLYIYEHGEWMYKCAIA